MNIKKIYLVGILSTFLLFSLIYVGVVNAAQNEEIGALTTKTGAPLPENYLGANFKGGEIAYQVTKAINHTANTFQAVVRMEKNNYTSNNSSIIFGNYNYYNALTGSVYECNKYVNYEIDKNGHVVVDWAKTRIIFTSVDIRTNEWVHIAVVRDIKAKCFVLYVNGILTEKSNVYSDVELDGNEFKQRIGFDCSHGSLSLPFYGEIGHVSLYYSPKTESEIYDDYSDILNISYKTRDYDLAVSYNLEHGQDVIYDKSINCNSATIMNIDYFYDGEFFATGDYSFGVVGDTQVLARYTPESLKLYSKWAVENKDRVNLQAMLYMGDLTDGRSNSTDEEFAGQYIDVAEGFSIMDGKVPYVFVPGNHDYKADSNYRDLTMYNKYLPYSKYSNTSYFAGAYEEGQTQNTYYTFETHGVKYLVMALEFGPEAKVMEWVCDVLEQYSDYRAIIITHGFLGQNEEMYDDFDYLSAYWYFRRKGYSATSSRNMWEKYLSYHENVFMILCGHSTQETIAYKPLKGKNGNTTMVFRIDHSYLVASKGFDTTMALFNFDETAKTISINYFSVEKNKLFNVQNQMIVSFDTYKKYTTSYFNMNSEVRV